MSDNVNSQGTMFWPMPKAGEVWQDFTFPEQTARIVYCDGFKARAVYHNSKTGETKEVDFFVQQGCFVAMQYGYAKVQE